MPHLVGELVGLGLQGPHHVLLPLDIEVEAQLIELLQYFEGVVVTLQTAISVK